MVNNDVLILIPHMILPKIQFENNVLKRNVLKYLF